MKHKFQIPGISCGGCVSKVKKALESHPAIEKAEVYQGLKGARVITMKEKFWLIAACIAVFFTVQIKSQMQ